MVNNFDGTDWVGDIVGFLNNPAARALFRRQAAQFLSSGRYRGLMIDFEAFPASGQPGYVALLKELSSDLHARGMKLYVAVPPHNGEYDYPAIAAAADGIVLMNYDEHFPGAASGSSGLAGLVCQEPEFCQDRHSAGKNHLRHRQLWLRLGAETQEGKPAAGGPRHTA